MKEISTHAFQPPLSRFLQETTEEVPEVSDESGLSACLVVVITLVSLFSVLAFVFLAYEVYVKQRLRLPEPSDDEEEEEEELEEDEKHVERPDIFKRTDSEQEGSHCKLTVDEINITNDNSGSALNKKRR